MMIRYGRRALLLALCLACANAAVAQDAPQGTPTIAQQIRALHWVEGPTQVSVGTNATFDVPAGYRFLGPADTVKFMALTQNLSSDDSETVFAPNDFAWWGVFNYTDAGHVSDQEKIDPDALLSTLRSTQERANKQLSARGWPTLQIVGWEQAPFYDPQTHNLSWAMEARDSNGGEVINYNTRLLSRTGFTAATLVDDPRTLQASVSQFKNVVAGYRFVGNQTYASYKPGDKTAEYGLAALITGGAVAVAAKTGLWKVIVAALVAGWKVVAAFVVALFASIGKFFKRLTGRNRDR